MAMIGLGATSIAHGLAQAMKGRNPDLAHQLAPWDGQISARLAERRFANDTSAGSRLARRALQQDSTAVAAAAMLGLHAHVRGDAARARRLMTYAEHLSRRNLQTQLWALEDAVGRGDIPGALRHYDIALRTSKAAPDLLFPVLSTAISDPAIRSNLVTVLAKRPEWGPGFVAYVASKGPDARATVRLYTALRRAGVPISAEATSVTISRLIAVDVVDEAWRYYSFGRSDITREASRDPRFTAELSTPSAFDWTPIGDARVAASIQRSAGGGAFDFSAPPSVGGVVLQQMQLLAAGSYRLEGHGADIEQPGRSRPYWLLACRDGRELGRVVLPNSSQANGMFAGRLDVPAECPVQTLSLVLRSSDQVSGVAGRIDQVRLTAIR